MTKRQQKILDGLKLIGEDIAGFYRGGLEILYSHNPVKAHLLAHCGRELDAIMRVTFSYSDDKDEIQKKIKNEEVEPLEKIIGKKSIKGNVASILSALDISIHSTLAKKWIVVSTQFVDYAHRDSNKKKPRNSDEIEKLWEMYEDVLYDLIGNFNSLRNRVSRIIHRPSEEILDRLPNLFNNKTLKFEFFKELKSPDWLLPLYERGFFNPANIESEYFSDENNNQLIKPNWIELYYLTNIAKENINNPKVEISNCLNQFIKSYINYRSPEGKPVQNTLVDYNLTELIINLDGSLIEDQYLDFIFQQISKESALMYHLTDKFIPNLINQNAENQLFKVINFLLEPKEVQVSLGIKDLLEENNDSEITEFESYKEYYSLLSKNYHFEGFYNKIPQIAEKYDIKLYNFLITIITDKIKSSQDAFLNSFEIPDVSTIDQYHDDKPFGVIVKTIYKTLLHSPSELNEIITSLLSSEIEIYQRIALQLIADKFEKYGYIFWNLSFNPIKEYDLNFEFSQFISKNLTKFSIEEVSKIIRIIEDYDKDYFHNDKYTESENEEYRCLEVLKFLNLLNPLQLNEINDKISEYTIRSKRELSNINSDFRNGINIHWSSGENIPESSLEFEEKTIEEIHEYLITFDEKDEFGRSLKNGAYTSFYNDIVRSPEKYFPKLDIFLDLENEYLYQILKTIERLANENKGEFMFWQMSFDFIEKRLVQGNYDSRRDIKAILRLIENFTKDDSTAFDISLMPIAKNILQFISKFVSPQTKDINEIERNLFNIEYNYLIHALIQFSLRNARINLKDEEEKWDIDIKTWIEIELRNNPSIDLHAVLGIYLPNLDYLSKNWVILNINLLFPANESYWIATFSSFNFFVRQNPYIYFKLLNHGDYRRIISYESNFSKLDSLKNIITDNICWFAIVRVIEDSTKLSLVKKSNELLTTIIQLGQVNFQKSIIRSLVQRWGKEDRLLDQDIDFRHILRQLYKNINKNIQVAEYESIAGYFNDTLCLVSNLDEETIEWFKFSIRYLKKSRSSKTVFNFLKLHLKNNIKQVGELLIEYSKYFKNEGFGIYDDTELKFIVDYLFKAQEVEIADEICDNLGHSGFQGLKEIFDKYHPL